MPVPHLAQGMSILEQQPELAELMALDISEQQLQRVRENGERLGLAMTTVPRTQANCKSRSV